jgi:hypothetical protein
MPLSVGRLGTLPCLSSFASSLNWAATDVLDKLLDPLFDPLKQMFASYAEIETLDTAAVISDPSPATIGQWWHDLGGSVFLLGLVAATVVLVLLVLVQGVAIGVGFLLGMVFSLPVSVLVQDLMASSPLAPGSLGESRSISAVDSVFMDAVCSVDEPVYRGACGNSTIGAAASTLGGAVSDFGSYFSSGIAAELLVQGEGNPVVYIEVGFALGICGIAFAGYAYSVKDWRTAFVGAFVSALGIDIDVAAPEFEVESLILLDQLATGIDGATFVGSVPEVVAYL